MRGGHAPSRFFRSGSVADGNRPGLRRSFLDAVYRLTEVGFEGAWRLFDLTPMEVEWEISAFAARRRLELERMDELAWLVGRYAAIGVNAPRRYPKRPDSVVRRTAPMNDEAMKQVFLRLAQRVGERERNSVTS